MGAKQSLKIDAENYYKVEDDYAMKTTGTHSSLTKIFDSLEERTGAEANSHADSKGKAKKIVGAHDEKEVAENRYNRKTVSPPTPRIALSRERHEERML